MLGPEVEVLGQPVARGGIGEVLRRPERLPDGIEDAPGRVAGRLFVVGVQRVDANGRLERFVMLRERPFVHLVDGKEPRHPFGVHDEGVHPRFRRHVGLVVGHVGAAPDLAVPPHQALLRIPGLALQVSRGTVVENAPVHRPGPGPTQVLLHTVGVAVIAAGHLVALLGPAAAEDPAAGRRAAVVLELGKTGQLLPGLDRRPRGVGDVGNGVAVELLGNLFGRRRVGHLVGPTELEYRLGEGTAVGLVTLTQTYEQVAHDFYVGA